MALSSSGPDDLETVDDLRSETWDDRIGRGEEAERHFASRIRIRNLHAIEQKPMIRDDLMTRHFPDIAIRELPGILCQIADGRRSSEHMCVIKEAASLDGARAAFRTGSVVFVLWEMPDGSFRGNRVERLEIIDRISDTARKNGSGTPGWKIDKRSLVSLDSLIDEVMAA